jgi:hypothetical protein
MRYASLITIITSICAVAAYFYTSMDYMDSSYELDRCLSNTVYECLMVRSETNLLLRTRLCAPASMLYRSPAVWNGGINYGKGIVQ